MGKVTRGALAAAILIGAIGVGPAVLAGEHDGHCQTTRRQTERLVRRLFDRRELADVDAIWDMFADGGTIVFPFTGDASIPPAPYRKPQDEQLFKAQIGGLLADLENFQLTDLVFQSLKEEGATLVAYDGTATVRHNGEPLVARFITEVHTRCGLFTSYAEYYDTQVLQDRVHPLNSRTIPTGHPRLPTRSTAWSTSRCSAPSTTVSGRSPPSTRRTASPCTPAGCGTGSHRRRADGTRRRHLTVAARGI